MAAPVRQFCSSILRITGLFLFLSSLRLCDPQLSISKYRGLLLGRRNKLFSTTHLFVKNRNEGIYLHLRNETIAAIPEGIGSNGGKVEDSSGAPQTSHLESFSQIYGVGWSDRDNTTRNYVCLISTDGRPCGPRKKLPDFPQWLFCPSGQCCSKNHGLFWNGVFTSGHLCTGLSVACVITNAAYGGGRCNCEQYKAKCPENSTCHDELIAFGGAYCMCNEGYTGNGKICYKNACDEGICHPGKCTMNKDQVQCTCPKYYEAKQDKCVAADSCKLMPDPCGPPDRVVSCTHLGPNDWMCTCRPGYVMVRTEQGPKCEPAHNSLSCENDACGTDGLKGCKDTEAGVVCTCMENYHLERIEPAGFRCRFDDKCTLHPCGSETVAKGCFRDINEAGYRCECQNGAELTENPTGPYCKAKDPQSHAMFYIFIVGSALLLVSIGGYAIYFFQYKPPDDIAPNDFFPTGNPYDIML